MVSAVVPRPAVVGGPDTALLAGAGLEAGSGGAGLVSRELSRRMNGGTRDLPSLLSSSRFPDMSVRCDVSM